MLCAWELNSIYLASHILPYHPTYTTHVTLYEMLFLYTNPYRTLWSRLVPPTGIKRSFSPGWYHHHPRLKIWVFCSDWSHQWILKKGLVLPACPASHCTRDKSLHWSRVQWRLRQMLGSKVYYVVVAFPHVSLSKFIMFLNCKGMVLFCCILLMLCAKRSIN